LKTQAAFEFVSHFVGGKNTLLMFVAGLNHPMAGSTLLDGVPAQAGDRRVSLILQHYDLFPWSTVAENVAIGLRARHVEQSVRRAAVARQLSRVGLSECCPSISQHPGWAGL